MGSLLRQLLISFPKNLGKEKRKRKQKVIIFLCQKSLRILILSFPPSPLPKDSFPQTPTITCSAGGKVLLTGAYLVLSEVYSGLVMAVDARIYTSCSLLSSLPEDLSTSSLGSFNEEKRKEWRVVFEIVSEQLGFVSRYVVVFGTGEEGPFVALHPLNPQEHNPNPYFESAILFSCSSLFALLIKEKEGEVEEAGEELFGRLGGGKGLGVRLVVRADNHFYSQHRNLKERGKELRFVILK